MFKTLRTIGFNTSLFVFITSAGALIMADPNNHDVDALFEDDPGPIEEEDVGELDLGNMETKVWLVKIPKFLAAKWNNLDSDGVELGNVRIYNE